MTGRVLPAGIQQEADFFPGKRLKAFLLLPFCNAAPFQNTQGRVD